MTRRYQLIIGDDLVAFASKGKEHVDADETLVIAIGPDLAHLKVREVDLITANADALREFLEPYLRAGHVPDGEPELLPSRAPLPPHPGQGKRRELPGTRLFLQELRMFAEAGGDPVPSATGKSGKTNYRPRPDQYAAFIAHLARPAGAGDQRAASLLEIARQLGLDVPVPQDKGLPAGENGQLPLTAAR
jgi:hypothetical protein